MVHADKVSAGNKMEELRTGQSEHISQDAPKSPYAKRSNVVGMWRKREEAMKASNAKLKEQQTRQIEVEEKKESIQEFEHDSRQQEKNMNDMFPSDPFADMNSERNAPEPVATTTTSAPVRRSNIRDSWKKRAASSPSANFSQPALDISRTTSGSAHNRIIESPSNASGTAFDELKSKWKKFGVQNEQNSKPETIESKIAKNKVGATVEDKTDEPFTPEEKTEKATDKDTKPVAKPTTPSRGISARRIGSNRFKSRFDHTRSSVTASTSSDEIEGASAAPEKQASGTPVSPEASPSDPFPVVEKRVVPPSPPDEMGNACAPKSPEPNYGMEGTNAVTPISPASSFSRSSLSNRAHRKLRNMRTTSQPRTEEHASNVKDTDMPMDEAIPVDEAMPMDESIAFKESLLSQNTNSSATDDNFLKAQTSPLNAVVPSMETMVPDQFFSEKDANFASITTVIQQTSFSQIANDIKEEACTLLELDIVNNGIHSALDTLGLGDLFPKSPRKIANRAPSPVEEVAIEVEYVADGEE